jgi:hypothetical protein
MSAPGTRPGGLTALAVISFIWALFELIAAGGTISSPWTIPLVVKETERQVAEGKQKQADLDKLVEANQHIQNNKNLVLAMGAVEGIFGIVLIVAGIGYLKQKRGIGKRLGTAYAVAAIIWGAAGFFIAKHMSDGKVDAFSLMSLIGFIVPVATLLGLTVMFKDDFPNP